MTSFWERIFTPTYTPPTTPLAQLSDEFTVDLQSHIEGDHLQATFTLHWWGPVTSEEADRNILRHEIIWHSRPEAKRYTAARLETAQTAINARLARLSAPKESQARGMTVSAQLSADGPARETAAEWEKLQSQLALSRLKNQLDMERLRHLRDEIFTKPEVARTYWLERHPEALDAVLADSFERVAEKLTSGPEPSALAVANVIREFLRDLGPEHRQVLMELLHKALADFGRADLALRLPTAES